MMDRGGQPKRRLQIVVGTLLLVILVSLATIYGREQDPELESPSPSPSATTVSEAGPIPGACQDLRDRRLESTASSAPTVFTNATVITMDRDQTRSEAVALADGQIAGLDSTSASDAEGAAIDLEGATVLPGFIDSHSHWIGDRDQVGHDALQAIHAALSSGWTSISELFVTLERLDELCQLEKDGELRLKVGAFLPLNYENQRFGHLYDAFEPGEALGPHLIVQGLKFFADRSPDGLGYLTKPPDPSVQGQLFWEPDELGAEFERANDAGWQIAIHATGDGGLDVALEAFEAVDKDDIMAARDRIEHLTAVRDDQIQKIKDLGLIGSIQLSFFHADAAKDLVRWLGRDRVRLSGRWRDIIDAGIPIAGSTDHPWALVGSSGPAVSAIAQAVTRQGANGDRPPPWLRSQRMTIEEALRALTLDAAFAQGTDDRVGSIEVGKDADLVILAADPTAVAPKELADIDIVATIVDGSVEYCGESVPSDLEQLCTAQRVARGEGSSDGR